MGKCNEIAEGYCISYLSADNTDTTKGNVFRPYQPSEIVAPGVGLIVASIVWIGYTIHLIKIRSKLKKEGRSNELEDCGYLHPEYGEIVQDVLWALFGHDDIVVGGDWACTNPKNWLFDSKSQNNRRIWPSRAGEVVNLIANHKVDEYKGEFLNLLGTRFRRYYREATQKSIEKVMESSLMPRIREIFSTKKEECELKIALARELVRFIRERCLEIKQRGCKIDDEKARKKLCDTRDIINDTYGMENFLSSVLGVDPDNVDSLGELEELENIVNSLREPKYTERMIDILLNRLYENKEGHSLLVSMILFDYAGFLMQEDDECSLKDDYDGDKCLLQYFEKMLRLGPSKFNEYISSSKLFHKFTHIITFHDLERSICFWEFNYFLYLGEVVMREYLSREEVLEEGINIENIEDLFNENDWKIDYIKRYLGHIIKRCGGTLEELRRHAKDEANKKGWQNKKHLAEFMEVLVNSIGTASPPDLFFDLLRTNKSIYERNMEKFSRLPKVVVFPGKGGIIKWINELRKMMGEEAW